MTVACKCYGGAVLDALNCISLGRAGNSLLAAR